MSGMTLHTVLVASASEHGIPGRLPPPTLEASPG